MVSPLQLRAHPSITGCDLPCVFHPYTLIGRRNFTDLLVLYDRLGSVGYKFCFLRELISCFHRFFVTMCEKWGGGGGESRFVHGHEIIMQGNLCTKHVPSGPHRYFIGLGYHAALLFSRIASFFVVCFLSQSCEVI